MKIRTLLLAGLLVGGFVYLTSVAGWDLSRLVKPVAYAGRLWSEPDRAKTAGLSSDELNNIEIYKAANQATVNISTVVYTQNFFFGVVPSEGAGSGFLIDADGRILTNNHVVAGRGAQIKVILADRSSPYEATVLYREPDNDLALLKINPKKKLPFLRLGDSDGLQVGQKALAIGNPFGLGGTLTTGIISSLHRSVSSEDQGMEDMIQTDAAINPGNSGGPLLDSQGAVIGINTMIVGAANVGIGFALPISRAKRVLENYSTEGRYGRPDLGASGNYVSGQLAEALELPAEGGILVSTITPGSPAQQAGLRGARRRVVVGGYIEVPYGGDLIMAIDGRPLEGRNGLERATRGKRPGDSVELTIYRDGRTLKVKVTLGQTERQL